MDKNELYRDIARRTNGEIYIGVLGPVRTGKSTFIKMLLGEVQPDSGKFDIGETVRFGYFSQEGLKFREDQKVIDVITEIADYIDLGGGKHMTASQFLQFFLFTPEEQHNYVYKLSGGEKRKLYLCTVLMRNPNFLVLDEPTNDLDIVTINILEEYLKEFKGTLILVSHDRHFLDRLVDHLFVFCGDGEVKDFIGSYSQYREFMKDLEAEKRSRAREEERAAKAGNSQESGSGQTQSRPDAPRKLSYKEQRELELLEKDIESLTAEKEDLESRMNGGLTDPAELQKVTTRFAEVSSELDAKETRWLELSVQ